MSEAATAAAARPGDFDEYWGAVDEDLARYPAAPELEPYQLQSTEFCTVSGVKLTSVGPYRIFGYYSVPRGEGPFPGLLRTPRYGSVNHVPPAEERERYAVLQVMHRGQRRADQPFAASYPGLLTHGIEDPAGYVYRGVVADCLRGFEFLVSRAEVDPTRVGVAGDDLALLVAARRSGLAAVEAAGLMLYRLMEARARTDAYPVEEINDYLRTFPERRDAVARTLTYFDPVHHAPHIGAATVLSVGDRGSLSGPEWLAPLRDGIAGPVEPYELTHEGATDHDWLDAWLARQLGTEPRPKSWQVAG